MIVEPACPCETFEYLADISNPPGLGHVAYRAGDFRSVRRALLRQLPGETNLPAWKPAARGDLLLQLVEWWAYVADILIFYNERSLNENLVGTASLDESVRRLVDILGYRPRPGLASSVRLGVLLAGTRALVLPAGFAVTSKPAPGKEPQTFETSEAYGLGTPDAVPARPDGLLLGAGGQLFLSGTIRSLQPGERMLLEALDGSARHTFEIASIAFADDPEGRPYTEIAPKAAVGASATAKAAAYRLMRGTRRVGLWKSATTAGRIVPHDPVSTLHLEAVERAIAAGQIVVIDAPGAASPPAAILSVSGTSEAIWYVNGDASTPPAPPAIAIPAVHTVLSVTGTVDADWNSHEAGLRVLANFEPVAPLRDAPAFVYAGLPADLAVRGAGAFRVADAAPILIEDADDQGVFATGSVLAGSPARLHVDSFDVAPVPSLKPPLHVLHNVVALSRGKTVPREVLGIGNAATGGQEFVLKKSPLTYLPKGDGYRSTLAIHVHGERWQEVPSFYGQPADARVFVTAEDGERKTRVKFGDWINGAGLPSGAEVTATYRVEADGETVEPGKLTSITKPLPGVASVRQPVAAGGGADPERMTQVRTLAPKSVLTFGRAISSDDYEVIASRAPAVTRVRSYYDWNPAEQRATVVLYVGDGAGAVASARAALLESADPNRPVSVLQATQVKAGLVLGLSIAPDRIVGEVEAAVRAALADPDTGLFGVRRMRIGQGIFRSRVSQACLSVAGVRALTHAAFTLERPDLVTGSQITQAPHVPAEKHEFFAIPSERIAIQSEVSADV